MKTDAIGGRRLLAASSSEGATITLITSAAFVFHIFATGFRPAIIDFYGGQGDGL